MALDKTTGVRRSGGPSKPAAAYPSLFGGGDKPATPKRSGSVRQPAARPSDSRLSIPRNSVTGEIIRQAKIHHVPAAIALAVAKNESGFNQEARSPAGAIGVMQLMPATARGIGVDPYNWRQNIEGGVRYLASLYRNLKNWRYAVAGYNAGGGAVTKYGGVPPYPETQRYVERVINDARSISNGKIDIPAGNKAVAYISAPLPGQPTMTSDYGPREAPTAGAGDFHYGVDLAAPAGTPIHAMIGGTVTYAAYNEGGGNTVDIRDASGRTWTYHHMIETPIVKEGQRVKAGQQIGNVGSTGVSTGNHLHIGLRLPSGQWSDPMRIIRRSFKIGWDNTAKISLSVDDFGGAGFSGGGGGSVAGGADAPPEQGPDQRLFTGTESGTDQPDTSDLVDGSLLGAGGVAAAWEHILSSGVTSPETQALAMRAQPMSLQPLAQSLLPQPEIAPAPPSFVFPGGGQ